MGVGGGGAIRPGKHDAESRAPEKRFLTPFSPLAPFPPYDASQRLVGAAGLGLFSPPGTLLNVNLFYQNCPLQTQQAALGNGLVETRTYSSRCWLNSLQVGSGGSAYSISIGYAGNGDVTSANASVNGNWNYAYDGFNRLCASNQGGQTSVTCTSANNTGQQAYTYGYDRFGNRWSQALTGGSGLQMPLSFNGNNQISSSGYRYDAAGNLVMDGLNCYTYDAENRLSSVAPISPPLSGICGADTMSYLYDAEGRRVARLQSGAVVKQYYYDAAGHMITEANSSGTWLRAEIYAGNRHVATWNGGATYFNHADWLGTERARTYGSGPQAGQICETITSLPFGDGQSIQPQNGGCAPTPAFFTGKERDSESGNDYFGARYYGSTIGRFMTPDSPSYSNHKNPQTWNLYAYSLNNPVTFRDADGHKIDCANNAEQCQRDAAAATANAEAAARVTTQTTTTEHSFLGIFHWTTTETQIAIKGDINSFRALSPNAAKLADLVTDSRTVTVRYDNLARQSGWDTGLPLHGGSTSYMNPFLAIIDPTRTPGAVYDPDAIKQGLPQANTAEEFGHEVLGHIWGDMIGGHPAGTRANMRDSIEGENAVRALDPTRGQKGIESHHNYNEMPPDNYKPQQ
jgi:RHS repeat-associated protein